MPCLLCWAEQKDFMVCSTEHVWELWEQGTMGIHHSSADKWQCFTAQWHYFRFCTVFCHAPKAWWMQIVLQLGGLLFTLYKLGHGDKQAGRYRVQELLLRGVQAVEQRSHGQAPNIHDCLHVQTKQSLICGVKQLYCFPKEQQQHVLFSH